MTKKKLLKRIENLETALISSDLGYMEQIKWDKKGRPTKHKFHGKSFSSLFKNINEKLDLFAEAVGKKFQYKHTPQRDLEIIDVKNDTKRVGKRSKDN